MCIFEDQNGLLQGAGLRFSGSVRFLRILVIFGLAVALAGCGRPSGGVESPPEPPDLEAGPADPVESIPKVARQVLGDAVGVWTAADDRGVPMDLVLFDNGQAVTTHADTLFAARGGRGFWRLVEGHVLVAMADGTSILLEESPEGVLLSKSPAGPGPEFAAGVAAERLEGPTAEWVGAWRLNREPDGSFLYITLRSDGTAFSSINGLTEGRWEVRQGAAVCTWPDGWIDRIERASGGWLKKSWVGGETETPADLSDAIRVGESAFTVEP